MKEKIIKKLKEFVVTGFFIGYIPFMPGTFGTLLGVGIFILVSPIPAIYYSLIVALLVISIPLSDYAEKHIFKQKNSPHIVIDEILGYLVAMVSFSFDGSLESIKYIVIGFGLFRLFDIWKPYPIRKSLHLEHGLGVVVPDILAAIYTNLFLQFLRVVSPYLHF